MKKVIVAILIIGIIAIGIFFFSNTTNKEQNLPENKLSVEEYVDKSYLQNIIRYKIIHNTAPEKATQLVNVINENDVKSIKGLFIESDKIEAYSYENTSPEYYMIAYLIDNSAIKIEGVKDEVKITSIDDESTVEYYKFRLEEDFQGYLLRKYEKYAKDVKYYLYKENEKFGVFDSHNNRIFEPKYDYIKIINNYVDLFFCSKGEKIEILDINENNYYLNIGEKISEIEVTDSEEKLYCDILKFESNKKYGLLGLKGEKLSEPEYDNIYSLGMADNYVILEKEESKKQLCKVNLDGLEMLAEYDEFSVKKDETTLEYIIYGKNKDEEEQVIHIEKVHDNIQDYPEMIGELSRVYENGLYYYVKIEIPVQETDVEPENIDKSQKM